MLYGLSQNKGDILTALGSAPLLSGFKGWNTEELAKQAYDQAEQYRSAWA